MSQEPGLGPRLLHLRRAAAGLSPRKKIAVTLLGVLVVLTWLAACAVLASLFV